MSAPHHITYTDDILPTPPELSFDLDIDDGEDNPKQRGVEDLLNEFQDHLTKEEQLLVSLYKNFPKQRNNIHRIFFKKYHGRMISTSAISQKKRQMFKVLACLGELMRFKRENNIDNKLQGLLTLRQYQALILHERRKTIPEMMNRLGVSERAIQYRWRGAVNRIKDSSDTNLNQYLHLLALIFRFSRKHCIK